MSAPRINRRPYQFKAYLSKEEYAVVAADIKKMDISQATWLSHLLQEKARQIMEVNNETGGTLDTTGQGVT